MKDGNEKKVQEIVNELLDYKPFFDASGGGITVSGGEPLLQLDFLLDLFKECKKHGIHTTIDTSGAPFSRRPQFLVKLDELLTYTDLILLDLKHIDPEKHKMITGMTNEHILDFARYLSEKQVPVWIRHVLVPALTDFDEDLHRLGDFIKTLNNVQKIEVLPYHKMGVYKWEKLGLDYKLTDVESPSPERVEYARNILNASINANLVYA